MYNTIQELSSIIDKLDVNEILEYKTSYADIKSWVDIADYFY